MIKQLTMMLISVSLVLPALAAGQQVSKSGALGAVFDSQPSVGADPANQNAARLNLDGTTPSAWDHPPLSEDTMQLLNQRTNELNTEISEMLSGRRQLETSSIQPSPVFDQTTHSDNVEQRQRVREIEERIELLGKIYDENAATYPPAPLTPSSAASASQVSDADMTASGKTTPESVPLPPSAELMPMPVQTDKQQPIDIAERVVPEPVNALEMGNSLFMTGDAVSALRVYNAVQRDKINTFDAGWLDFMIAVCNRRIGNVADSESVFREIANEKSKEPTVTAAQQWLKYIETNQRTRAAIDQIDSELNQLLERADQHAGNQ